MKKKLLSVLLSLAMTLTVFSPFRVFAEELEVNEPFLEVSDETPADDKTGDLEVAPLPEDPKDDEEPKLEVATLRMDLQMAVRAVDGITPENDKEKEMLTKYNEAVDELDGQITRYEESLKLPAGAVGGIEEIIDVQTIPVRIQLLIRIGRAIRFGTTELSNKIVAAHTKLTEYVLVGILYVLNPFASNDQILQYIDSWEALQQELLSYPDLQPGDIATIYKKAAVSRELREARKVKWEADRSFKKFQARQLGETIAETSRMIWRITITCGELDTQVEKLKASVEKVTGPKIRVEKIEFMEGTQGYIHIDETTTIRPVIFPNEVKNKDFIMYSSNSYVARVEGTQIVPKKLGSVKITVVALDNSTKANFDLIITEPGAVLNGVPKLQPTGINTSYNVGPNPGPKPGPTPDPYIPGPVGNLDKQVTKVSFNAKEMTLELGENYELSKQVLVFPKEAVDKKLRYQAEDENIVKVDENGVITALKEGTTKVVAESESGAIDAITVKVVNTNKEEVYELKSIDFSKKVAGVFTVSFEALKDGENYTGPATLELTSGNRTRQKRFYFEQGKGSVKFNGFEFGVWRTEFEGKVSFGTFEKTFETTLK